jgi:arylformamidase
LQSDLKLTPSQVQRCSPAYFATPGGCLYAVCGGDESAEFKNQNRLIENAWGKRSVPVCETIAGLNHFSILEALVRPGQQVHALALQMLAA